MRSRRKLLIASAGVAAIAYGCQKGGSQPEPVGNLVAPEPAPDAATAEPPPEPAEPPVGNLVAP